MTISIPEEVSTWISRVFAQCNRRVATKMSAAPTVHESWLDFTFIECISQYAAPVRFADDWTVRLDTHFVGSGHHWRSWEVADIGILVLYRQRGRVVRAKVGLLQSKRLYPVEQAHAADDIMVSRYNGFGDLWQSEDVFLQVTAARTFTFKDTCRYKALTLGDEQCLAIRQYEEKYSIPVFYLMYHPLRVPWTAQLPIISDIELQDENEVGCNVVPSSTLYSALGQHGMGYTPSFGDVRTVGSTGETGHVSLPWRLEHFVVNELLGCHEGYVAERHDDPGVQAVFFGRTSPISAAIGINIEVPPEFDGFD